VEARKFLFDVYEWEEQHRGRRLELVVDILVQSPLRLFRLSADTADYRHLENRSHNTFDNFFTTVRRLFAALPQRVGLAPTAVRFVQTLDFRLVLFDKPDERDSFVQWLTLATVSGQAFASVAAASLRPTRGVE
jgi:hypothetical protein